MKKNNRTFLLGIFLLGSLIVFTTNCRTNNQNNKAQKLVVGIQNSPSNSLIIVAAQKGFFDNTKVNVEIKPFTAGKLALQALLGNTGDIDVAVSAETPVVLSSLGGNQLKVITQIVNAKNECRVVVRKDGDLMSVDKYFSKKRKIATSQGGSPEWLTYNFLKKYSLGKDKVEVIAMAPENMPVAIIQKAIDGCSIFDPFARIAEKELGANGLRFLNEDMKSYYVMSVKENILKEKGDALIGLIEGLKKASDFIRNNPDEAKQIVAIQTKLDKAILDETWANYNFNLGLEPALIELCKAQAQWAIETGKYPKETPIPDFNQILSKALLEKITINAQ